MKKLIVHAFACLLFTSASQLSAGKLHDAVASDDIPVVKKILRGTKSKTLNEQDALGATPLFVATENNNATIVSMLLKKGANPNIAKTNSGRTPAHEASSKGYDGIMRLLIKNKVKVEMPDLQFNYPLHLAAREGHVDIVRQLLEYKGYRKFLNHYKRCPLYEAIRQRDAEEAKGDECDKEKLGRFEEIIELIKKVS